MTNRLVPLILLAGLGSIAALMPSEVGAECATCTAQQQCIVGTSGAYCTIFFEEGEMWCNWNGECKQSMVVPEQISPTGTFLAEAGAVEDAARAIMVADCSGFVVDHLGMETENSLLTISL